MYVYMSVCTHVCTVCVCLSACTYMCVHLCPEALSADNLHLSLLSNITHTCNNDEPTTWQHFLDIAPCTIIVTSITSQDACHWNPTLLDHQGGKNTAFVMFWDMWFTSAQSFPIFWPHLCMKTGRQFMYIEAKVKKIHKECCFCCFCCQNKEGMTSEHKQRMQRKYVIISCLFLDTFWNSNICRGNEPKMCFARRKNIVKNNLLIQATNYTITSLPFVTI